MTLPSASSPDERPLEPCGEGDAAAVVRSPPAGAVSLADLIADSGPLPADAALECVQRIAERLTIAGHASRAELEPGEVFVDDDGGVWIRDSLASTAFEPEGTAPQLNGMDRLGKLLAFVATGDGAHLSDGAKVDPAILPPPLSAVASRLFSRNGACYRSYADLAREVAALRIVGDDAIVQDDATTYAAVEGDRTAASDAPPVFAVSSEADAAVDARTPAEVETVAADGEPTERNPRFAIALVLVFLFGAGIALVLWQLL